MMPIRAKHRRPVVLYDDDQGLNSVQPAGSARVRLIKNFASSLSVPSGRRPGIGIGSSKRADQGTGTWRAYNVVLEHGPGSPALFLGSSTALSLAAIWEALILRGLRPKGLAVHF